MNLDWGGFSCLFVSDSVLSDSCKPYYDWSVLDIFDECYLKVQSLMQMQLEITEERMNLL